MEENIKTSPLIITASKPGPTKSRTEWICKICNKEFLYKFTLVIHEQIDHKFKMITPTKCKYCGKELFDELQKHLFRDTNARARYKCEVCERKFRCKEELNIHKRKHEQIKSYECNYCEKQFFTKQQLSLHERVHTRCNLYKCQYCDKFRFIRLSDKKRHESTHTGIRPFQCKKCGKCFSRGGPRNGHAR